MSIRNTFILTFFIVVCSFASAGDVALLAVNCDSLNADEEHIRLFLEEEDYDYDCHTPGSIVERSTLTDYKAIYARLPADSTVSRAFHASAASPIIDAAINNGTHLIMENYGGIVGAELGVGRAGIVSGDFTGFGIGNKRGIGDIYFLNSDSNDPLLENIPSNTGPGDSNLIVKQHGVFSGTTHFEFYGDHTVVDYFTHNENSYHSEAGGAVQSTTSLPSVFTSVWENIYNQPYPGERVNRFTFLTAYQDYGNGRVTSLGPHFGGALSASQIEFGPVAVQMRKNALEIAGVELEKSEYCPERYRPRLHRSIRESASCTTLAAYSLWQNQHRIVLMSPSRALQLSLRSVDQQRKIARTVYKSFNLLHKGGSVISQGIGSLQGSADFSDFAADAGVLTTSNVFKESFGSEFYEIWIDATVAFTVAGITGNPAPVFEYGRDRVVDILVNSISIARFNRIGRNLDELRLADQLLDMYFRAGGDLTVLALQLRINSNSSFRKIVRKIAQRHSVTNYRFKRIEEYFSSYTGAIYRRVQK